MKIRDGFALGAISGVIGTIPQIIFDLISVQLGYSKFYAFQISGSIYLYKSLTYRPMGLILGGLIWETTGVLLGIITVYLIRLTGKEYWWLKGLVVSNLFMFTIIYGFLFSLGAARIIPWDIPTNVTIFMGNIIFGLVMSYYVMRWDGSEISSR